MERGCDDVGARRRAGFLSRLRAAAVGVDGVPRRDDERVRCVAAWKQHQTSPRSRALLSPELAYTTCEQSPYPSLREEVSGRLARLEIYAVPDLQRPLTRWAPACGRWCRCRRPSRPLCGPASSSPLSTPRYAFSSFGSPSMAISSQPNFSASLRSFLLLSAPLRSPSCAQVMGQTGRQWQLRHIYRGFFDQGAWYDVCI